mmetsp:Transcript_53489/g.121953  ORF Transcript_53489/g.121953 Transcript_53489/m.121953 type:complete len:425 (-) Transcript_53489:66-1340(-)
MSLFIPFIPAAPFTFTPPTSKVTPLPTRAKGRGFSPLAGPGAAELLPAAEPGSARKRSRHRAAPPPSAPAAWATAAKHPHPRSTSSANSTSSNSKPSARATPASTLRNALGLSTLGGALVSQRQRPSPTADATLAPSEGLTPASVSGRPMSVRAERRLAESPPAIFEDPPPARHRAEGAEAALAAAKKASRTRALRSELKSAGATTHRERPAFGAASASASGSSARQAPSLAEHALTTSPASLRSLKVETGSSSSKATSAHTVPRALGASLWRKTLDPLMARAAEAPSSGSIPRRRRTRSARTDEWGNTSPSSAGEATHSAALLLGKRMMTASWSSKAASSTSHSGTSTISNLKGSPRGGSERTSRAQSSLSEPPNLGPLWPPRLRPLTPGGVAMRPLTPRRADDRRSTFITRFGRRRICRKFL